MWLSNYYTDDLRIIEYLIVLVESTLVQERLTRNTVEAETPGG